MCLGLQHYYLISKQCSAIKGESPVLDLLAGKKIIVKGLEN